jgi:N-acyl-D-amino-acid deacylase
MQQPWVSIGSDAGAAAVLGEVDDLGLPHPRSYGTFPRIIAKYVREEGVLTLEDAIRKMTSWPARRMKLDGRGLLTPGYWADVVIFDYDTIQDNATWEDAMQTPSGISHVLVNGVVVAESGKHTGQRPGKVLYGPGTRRQNSNNTAQ